ncbi:MAG: Mur ligase family protein, partial [Collinsella sp.]
MRYIELLEEDDLVVSKPSASCDQRIEFATDDSRQVRPGTLFVCKGRAFKREYLLSAIADGAVAYVSEVDYDVDLPAVIVSDIRRTLAVVADTFYGHPSGKVKVCAFTGTKGKSTCSFYLRGILANEAKLTGCHRPALNTGIEFDDGIEAGPSKLTTPESFLLQSRIAHAAEAGAPWLVMEASSQGLKY